MKSSPLSTEFILRLIGAIVGAIALGFIGASIANVFDQPRVAYMVILGLLGFLGGIILTPYVTTRPLRRIRNNLMNMPPERLIAVILGVLLGLLGGGLFSIPLSFLPSPFREILPLASVLALSYLSASFFRCAKMT